MDRLNQLKSRKDARLVFRKNQNVVAHCTTNRCKFDGRIENVSSSGMFVSTGQQLPKGEEIAVSFTFPDSGNSVRATGKVARVTHSGVGIEILVYFKEKGHKPHTPKSDLKKEPRVAFFDTSPQSK
ncbi:MAG: PilZ domain-containing protein [Desulfobacterales bacterium]|jgi:hypothetical protein